MPGMRCQRVQTVQFPETEHGGQNEDREPAGKWRRKLHQTRGYPMGGRFITRGPTFINHWSVVPRRARDALSRTAVPNINSESPRLHYISQVVNTNPPEP